MWELIRANKRKSVYLVIGMALLLMVMGFAIGAAAGSYLVPSSSGVGGAVFFSGILGGGLVGLVIACFIWFVMSLTAYFNGGKILMAASGAKRIAHADHPQLHNVVEEMCIASGRATVPDIYLIDDMAPNAFAAGRDPDHAAVAVTVGLVGKLNRDELQGVIAHEMAHISNRDVLFMTMMGVMLGAIVMISHGFLRGLIPSHHGSSRRRGRSSSGGGQVQVVLMVIAVVLAVLAPFCARMIYFSASRRREYLADACAAMLTRYPEGLASALDKISNDAGILGKANKATAPMYISDPSEKRSLSAWSSTHPPIRERISILRAIVGGAVSYGAYQAAWNKVSAGKAGVIPSSALDSGESLEVREPSVPEKTETREQVRQATDALRKVNDFLFLSCVCGMRMKLPPDFKHDHLACPRCKRDVAVPVAQLAAMRQVADALESQTGATGTTATAAGGPLAALEGALGKTAKTTGASDKAPLEVTRTGPGWMTFQCECGHNISLSPTFELDHTKCGKCQRDILVKKSRSSS